MAGEWEVVGGKSKKPKSKKNDKKGPKSSTSSVVNSSPVVISGPIEESVTMFDAFLDKAQEIPPTKEPKHNDVKRGDKHATKKKKPEKKNALKLTVEEAIAALNPDEFLEKVSTVRALYPTVSTIWLKSIASFLNLNLEASIEDPTFASKPDGYPTSLLHKKILLEIHKVSKTCTVQMLKKHFDYCLQQMIQEDLQGSNTLGYRIILQDLAETIPAVVLDNVPLCLQLCNTYQNRPHTCNSILWVAGQVGKKDLAFGFRVWNDLMFPLIGMKNCVSYVVDYLEKLIKSNKIACMKKSVLEVKDLFPILDFVYSKDPPKSVQKRLVTAYPTLKKLAYGPEPECTMSNFFPYFLHKLKPDCPGPLKSEILSSLEYCLEKDPLSYSAWRQLYIKHFAQSKLLISHIHDNYNTLSSKLHRKQLIKTLSVFQVTNEELVNSDKKNSDDIEECMQVCSNLLEKFNSKRFSWLMLVFLFTGIVFAILLGDTMTSGGSFKGSRIGVFLKDAGILNFSLQVYEKLYLCGEKAVALFKLYAPFAVEWCQTTLIPWLEFGGKQFLAGCGFAVNWSWNTTILAWNNTAEQRNWCAENLSHMLHYIDGQCQVYGPIIAEVLRRAAVHCSTFVVSYIQIVANAISSFLADEKVQSAMASASQVAYSLADNVHQYGLYVFKSAQDYFTSLSN